ncbi:CD276 antigen isoform X2 [Boleophthalmus pectinirostris]|uniref:CD276 antigen isoform X2 n=1 Tax=Boleophthalmus pectinirostris TaxID=150288 RepID=UPI00242BF83A|nr:CD276 antigen isoform X2 [Boleophthalmus pectinirostris]
MASSGILLLCLFIFSRVLGAQTGEVFVTVTCQKPEIVAQYGSSTLLDCNVQANSKITEPIKIVVLTWKFNGSALVNFFDGSLKKEDGFQLASRSWSGSNQNVSLLITQTTLAHDGEYEVDVVTNAGRNRAKVNVEVKSNYSTPEIRSDPEKINPDKSFSLTCTALGGYPKGNIRWKVDSYEWLKNPEVEVKQNQNGLYDLTSTLSFGADTQYAKFVCEVYNAKGVKEGQGEFDKTNSLEKQTGSDAGINPTKIVAPVVVIGALIVGLLMAILFTRRRQQNGTHAGTPDENNRMYEDP